MHKATSRNEHDQGCHKAHGHGDHYEKEYNQRDSARGKMSNDIGMNTYVPALAFVFTFDWITFASPCLIPFPLSSAALRHRCCNCPSERC